jgi:hypothetical protein
MEEVLLGLSGARGEAFPLRLFWTLPWHHLTGLLTL